MRRGDAQVDPFEQQAVSYHVALRGQFRMMAQSEPERWVVIDATQSADAIEQEIWTVLSQRVKARKGLL
jgi:dTMP kinase